MSISSISNLTTLSGQQDVGTGEMGKEEFLKLLTTQLANQDPLSPVKNEEFVAQLATFSSLEQQIGTNERLDGISMNLLSQSSASAVSFIGKDVRAMADWVEYDGSTPTGIDYELLDASEKVTLTIRDASGKLVRTVTLDAHEKGDHSYVWDGMDKNGSPLDEGTYTVGIAASNIDGDSVQALPVSTGRITGISYENGYPELLIGDHRITLADVIEVLEG